MKQVRKGIIRAARPYKARCYRCLTELYGHTAEEIDRIIDEHLKTCMGGKFKPCVKS